MPLDITHIDDAFLTGKNKLREFEKRWQQQFYKPVIDAQIGQMWQELPSEFKALALDTNPTAAKKIEQKFGGG